MDETSINNGHSKWLTIPAKIVSYLFHPLFIPTYVFCFLVFEFPFEFVDITVWQLKLKVFSVFWLTAFFPAFAVFLLWKLKFSSSIFLKTQKERIIPFFITMFFYWWMYYLSKNQSNQPKALTFFYFGVFCSTIVGVIINNFIKISLHAIAISGAMAAVFLFSIYYQTNLSIPVTVSIFIAGIVSTSRFLVSDHTPSEIYIGLALGFACQIVAYWLYT